MTEEFSTQHVPVARRDNESSEWVNLCGLIPAERIQLSDTVDYYRATSVATFYARGTAQDKERQVAIEILQRHLNNIIATAQELGLEVEPDSNELGGLRLDEAAASLGYFYEEQDT